jgi:xylulokinase
MTTFLVGIDLGTSGVKALVLDPEHGVLGTASTEYAIQTPHPGWAEQDPEVWFQASIEVIRRVIVQSGISPDEIAAIGFSGQMHGTVCLDARGKDLRPAIIWPDQRSRQQVERVRREIGLEKLGEWTGNPLATGFMLSSWLWLQEHEAETARATQHLLLPKDYLRYRFTGRLGSEPSDASSTSLFDPKSGGWSAPLLEFFAIDPQLLPEINPSAQVAGRLANDVAEAAGLHPEIPVAFGGSDQSCQALGNGVVAPGVVSCTIGTGGQLFAPLLSPTYDPQLRLHLFCHAIPDRWHFLAATLSAGLSLKWLRDSILAGYSYQELADLAAAVPPGSEGLFFLPYLVGERTPHMDPRARAAFIGLSLRHQRAHLVRAVMEGAVFSLRQGLDLMLALDVPVESIVASGGASSHPLWLQLQADIFNRPIYQTTTVEAAALGAALLAGVATGLFPDAPATSRQLVQLRKEVVTPSEENVRLYQESYEKYCRLYPRLKFFYP